MEGSSPKINKSENNHTVRFPKSSSEKSEENLEKKIQKQNMTEYLSKNHNILNNIKSEYTIKILFSLLDEKINCNQLNIIKNYKI